MANKINFITGETYTLAELFSGERRIIIPDLQRDYCWGDKDNKKSSGETGELVSDFINNLIEQYDKGNNEYDTLNLGLLYGYEFPIDHIQLCDGQQRITTLFLTLGVLNKKSGKFLYHLISNFELNHDDHEPYLNYAIRESSLYFLSDLVCLFFTEADTKSEDIKKSEWYFADYDHDPSIQSMISAIGIIESIFNGRDVQWLSLFGTWLLHHLTFMYFDMENRKNGEETFVIINSTGEPLSVAQNIKPLVLNTNQDVADVDNKWEKMETWFWRMRKGENDTADAGLSEFLRWVYMIETYSDLLPKDEQTSSMRYVIQRTLRGESKEKFPCERISFDTIYRYWHAVGWLFTEVNEIDYEMTYLSPSINKEIKGLNAIGQNDCFILLPVLKYVASCIEVKDCNGSFNGIVNETVKCNAIRLYEFFWNLIRLDNVSRSVNLLVYEALKAVYLLNNGDILSWLDKKDEISKQLFTPEEILKLELLKQSTDRETLEHLFWNTQRIDLWSGKILPLIEMSKDKDGLFDWQMFKTYEKLIDEKLLVSPAEHDDVTMLMRRAMIVALPKYKPIQRGWYVSFAWEWSDWRKFFAEEQNINNIKRLLDYCLKYKQGNENVSAALKSYISDTLKEPKDYAEFAKDDFLLSFTTQSKACDMVWGLSDWQICTSGGTGRHTQFFSRRNAYILREFEGNCNNNSHKTMRYLKNSNLDGWGVWYYSESHRGNCVVVQYKDVLKFDIRYLSESNICEIVMKSTKNKDIKSIADNMNFGMKKDSITECIQKIKMDFDVNAIKQYIMKLVYSINPYCQSINTNAIS